MNSPQSNLARSVTQIISETTRILINKPWPLLFFLGMALLFGAMKQVISDNSGQIKAVLSQLAPSLFSDQFILLPRTPFVVIGIAGLFLVLGWLFVLCCTVTVYISDNALKDRSKRLVRDIQAAVRTSGLAYRYLIMTAILMAIGLLLFVIPGIYIAIRLFVGFPAIILDEYSMRGAVRESWNQTSENEVKIGLILLACGFAGFSLTAIPEIGRLLAITVIVPVWLISSVVAYDRS